MDAFFGWIEATTLSTWLRDSPSLWVFPFVLILHTWGLAFFVGANVAWDLSALGYLAGVRVSSMERYFPVMWAGFWTNAVSGVLLLAAYPTKALTNPLFYVKLGLIAVGVVLAQHVRRHMRALVSGQRAPSSDIRMLAAVSLACWVLVIFAGRLLAYTCSRLMVDTPC